MIDYDRALLNDNERQVVAKLIEASKYIDEIYWRQVSEENPSLRTRLQRQSSASPADRAGVRLLRHEQGALGPPQGNEPFIEPFGPAGAKPPGAAFYPPDMTKEEFERYVAAHPDQKDALQGLFTVVRRQGNQLAAIRYSTYYRDLLEPAAQRIREAAAITGQRDAEDVPDQARGRIHEGRLPRQRHGLDGSRRADRSRHRTVRGLRRRAVQLQGVVRVVRDGRRPAGEREARRLRARAAGHGAQPARAGAVPESEPRQRVADPSRAGDLHRRRRAPRRADRRVQPSERRVRAREEGIEEGPAQERDQREVQPERQADRAARARRVAAAAAELRRVLQSDSLPRAVARPRPRLHHAAGRIARRSAHPAQEPLLHHRRNESRRPRPLEQRLRAQSQSAHRRSTSGSSTRRTRA